jgi:hypothetical protein
MRYATTIFSLLLLAGCDQTEILGCPEVREWSPVDQDALLAEISQPGFTKEYPETYRPL